MTERQAVEKYLKFCRMGRIPCVEYNMKTDDLNVYSVADPRIRITPLQNYVDITDYVWAYSQFGDILTAIRNAKVLAETEHGYGDRRIDFRSVNARLAEETNYNAVFTDDALNTSLDERYQDDIKSMEYDEIQGKLYQEQGKDENEGKDEDSASSSSPKSGKLILF